MLYIGLLNNCQGSVFLFVPFFQSLCCLRCPPKAVTDPPRKESPPSIVTYENVCQGPFFGLILTRKTSVICSGSNSCNTHSITHTCPEIKGGFCRLVGSWPKKGPFGNASTLPTLSKQARLACVRLPHRALLLFQVLAFVLHSVCCYC